MAELTDEEKKERQKVRREKRAGFFYDVSKLVIAGAVLSGITPVITKSLDSVIWPLVIGGAVVAAIFAYLADRILK